MQKIHPTVQALLTEIEAYCRLTGDNMTQFGIKVANDSHLVPRLRRGRQPRLATIDKMRKYMNGQIKAARPYKNGGKQ